MVRYYLYCILIVSTCHSVCYWFIPHTPSLFTAAPLPSVVTLPTVNLMEGEINVQLQFSRPTSPVAYFSLKYKWEVLYRDHWVSVHHRVSHKGRLNIENVTLSDAGLYRVNISNKFGYSLQTRQVTVRPITPSGGPTGVPTVPLGFMFQLPDMLSCSQLQVCIHQ